MLSPTEAQTTLEALSAEIAQLIDAGVYPALPLSDEQFNELALRLFAAQVALVEPYRRWCEGQGIAPELIERWEQIPLLPTAQLRADGPVERAEAALLLRTSGAEPATVLLPQRQLYDAAVRSTLAALLAPDGGRLAVYALCPDAQQSPASGLSQVATLAMEQLGTPQSRSFFGEREVDVPALAEALREAQQEGRPVCLIGSAAHYAQLIGTSTALRWSFQLPEGSRLLDTAGYGGSQGGMPRHRLYRFYQELLGLKITDCVNLYGLTELATPLLDSTLADAQRHEWRPRHKVVPPWMRVTLRDPNTLAAVEPGSAGLICVLDLASAWTVAALQTDDLGMVVGQGIEVVGRVEELPEG